MPNPSATDLAIPIHSDTPPPLALTRAILIYEGRSGALLTEHDVRDGLIQAGRPLDPGGFLQSLAHIHCSEEPALDDLLLVDHPRLLVWWRPASAVALFGESEDFGPFPRVGLRLPPMVFAAEPASGSLWVRALRRTARPDGATALFLLPLPNIYDNGQVCLGMRNSANPRSRTEWESLFFGTRFNHTHYRRRFQRCAGGPRAMIQKMRSSFRPGWLIPANQTLHAFVSQTHRAPHRAA